MALGIGAAAFGGGLLGITSPVLSMALASAVISAALLVVSIYLLRQEGSSIAALGLPTSAGRARELGAGFVITAALFVAVAWAQAAWVGAPWLFQGAPGVTAALAGLAVTGSMVLAEELLFRGMSLGYLRALCGDRAAILVSALGFGAYHLVGSQDWGIGAIFRFLMPAIGGLLFGWAAVRSGGLALPIGLHLGGNWVQSSVAGFAPGSSEAVPALWRIPMSGEDMQRLAAPDVGPRLPYVAAIAVAALTTWIFLRFRARERGAGETQRAIGR